jgi:RNA polymerase sigma factor (sigma-70 family)
MSLDPEEFANRCNEHRRALLCYAYTCSRDLALSEDIVQEALLIALKKRDLYFPEADLKGWLVSLVRNVWFRERDRLQKKQHQTKFIEENATLLFDFPQGETEPQARHRILQGCLQKLDQKEQTLIQHHFINNLKYSEIAAQMEQSVSWVKMRMLRARMALLECVRFNLQKEALSHEA